MQRRRTLAGLPSWAVLAQATILAPALLPAAEPLDLSSWTIHIANDNCPDYTWGFPEAETRQAFADIVRGHLDEMARTDAEPPESRNRYNMAVTQEALCFLERYPDRREELFLRIREGRVFVSPFLCNSLWGFQGVEGAIRTLYPARRLEREVGVTFDVAHHIECPSLPWGTATLLAGCGVRWLSVPFLDYDCTFGGLRCPPLFRLEGPDGSRIRVALDAWASRKANYTQGAYLLRNPGAISGEWVPHYERLGDAYPLRHILASGTHGDINPGSGAQARGFAEAIARHNAGDGPRPKLVNSTVARFAAAVDRVEEATPFLTTLRGCFGHSWDLWPLCAAKVAARMREGERALLRSEALLSLAILSRSGDELASATASDRERAEWCLAMLSDHAWNGTDERNRRHNFELRKGWSEELIRIARALEERGWKALGLEPAADRIVLFNGTSVPHRDIVRLDLLGDAKPRVPTGVAWQLVEEPWSRSVWFVAPEMPGYSVAELALREVSVPAPRMTAARGTEIEAPHCRLAIDPGTGGIASLVLSLVGREIVAAGEKTLFQPVLFDGSEHIMQGARTSVEAAGPVFARLRVVGKLAGADIEQRVTVYAELARIDVETRIRKPGATREERLLQFLPVLGPDAVIHVETTGAVVRPLPAPAGDLLPGADSRRMAVQGFVDVSLPGGPGVSIAPLDAFVLRLDHGPPAFEPLGNDQNFREVLPDQYGETDFTFRYSLRIHVGDYDPAAAFAWSRAVAMPIVARIGKLPDGVSRRAPVRVDARRAIATCLKPADRSSSGGVVLRVWETAGLGDPLEVGIAAIAGTPRLWRVDLLERDLGEVPLRDGRAGLSLAGHGFAALRIAP